MRLQFFNWVGDRSQKTGIMSERDGVVIFVPTGRGQLPEDHFIGLYGEHIEGFSFRNDPKKYLELSFEKFKRGSISWAEKIDE